MIDVRLQEKNLKTVVELYNIIKYVINKITDIMQNKEMLNKKNVMFGQYHFHLKLFPFQCHISMGHSAMSH